jgi:glycogen synthase
MRVVLSSREYPPHTAWGGIGSYTYSLAHALAGEGCEVHVVSCMDGPESVEQSDGVTVHRVSPPARRFADWRLRSVFPQVEERLLLARGVARAVRRLRPDVVEAPDWMAEGLLAGIRPRVPVVVHLHSPLDLVSSHRTRRPTADTKAAGAIERLAAGRAAALTASDPSVLKWPDGRMWTKSQVSRIPPPLATDLVNVTSRGACCDPGASNGAPIVAMVGRLDELKAPDTLMAALRLVRKRVPEVRTVFAGSSNSHEAPEGGEYGAWIERTARREGMRVEVVGQLERSQVLELYRAARVVVVPSRYESFSMTALEAVASSTPVVVSSSCGIASWLSGLGPGWVVPPGDPGALARAIEPMLTDESRAISAGMAGASLAMKEFDPATIARTRIALYGSLS